jgi:CIC family chloride channel protein
MLTDVLTVTPHTTTAELYAQLPEGSELRRQRLYPVLDADERMTGVLAWSDVLAARDHGEAWSESATSLARAPIVVRPDETLRAAADRMLAAGHGVLPVVSRDDPMRLVGMVTQFDLLAAHERVLIEERHRERPLSPRRLGDLGARLAFRSGS